MKKMRSKFERVLSLLMTLILMLNMVPAMFLCADAATSNDVTGSAYATDSLAADDQNAVVLDKTATLESNGTYTIDLSGYIKGELAATTVTTQYPLDVVMVLDASSSMLKYRKEYKQVTIPGRGKVAAYPTDVTSKTNLYSKFTPSTEYYGETLVVGVYEKRIGAGYKNKIKTAFEAYMAEKGYPFNVEYRSLGNSSTSVADFGKLVNSAGDIDVVIGVGGNFDTDAGVKYIKYTKQLAAYNSDGARYCAILKEKFSSVIFHNFIATTKYEINNKLVVGVYRRYIPEALQNTITTAFQTYMTNNGHAFEIEYRALGTTSTSVAEFGTLVNSAGDIDVVIGVGANIETTGKVEAIVKAKQLTAYQPAANSDRQCAMLTDKFTSATFYNFITGQKYVTSKTLGWQTNKNIQGSITFPVLPTDRIRCSSFNANSSWIDGICVTFFDAKGNVLEAWPHSKVYKEYCRPVIGTDDVLDEDRNYIVVPDGAVAMSVPLWTAAKDESDTADITIRNLDVEDTYAFNPPTEDDFQLMRVKLLQQQVEKFAESLRANTEKYGQDHKLSIVTFGAANDGQSEGKYDVAQGYYNNHVSVNGYNNYYFTNTGLFVNGTFKNYMNSAGVSSTKHYAYKPIFAGALSTSGTYYYLQEGTQDDISDAKPLTQHNFGYVRTVTYVNGKWTTKETGAVVTPRESPYDSNDKVLFLTRTSVAPAALTNTDYKNALSNVMGSDGNLSAAVKSAVDRIVARGGTETKFGLEMADNVLKNNPARTFTDASGTTHTGKQIVILFTDGNTDSTTADLFTYAKSIKNRGAELYMISVSSDVTDLKWMDQASSNFGATHNYDSSKAMSNGEYYMHIEDMAELGGIFETISNNLIISENHIPLDKNSVMQDVLATGLTLPSNFGYANIAVSTVAVTTTDDINFTDGAVTKFTHSSGGKYTAGSETLTVSFNRSTRTISVKGFDYAKYHVTSKHPGKKLVVKITGVEAATTATTGKKIATNTTKSGIAYTFSGVDGLYPFEVPNTILTTKTYVVDYAKPITINPSDFNMTTAVSLDIDGYNGFTTKATSVKDAYGNVSVSSGKITYTPTKTNWKGIDTFYVFGTTTNSTVKGATANSNGNVWAKINVIPANNVYYEDTFVTSTSTGTAGIVYSGTWTKGTDNGQKENAEANETTTNGHVHGWENTLADDTGFSGGGAYSSKTVGATATFTFTGTGVDIYSRTSKTTGIVLAMLYKGASADGSLVAEKALMVDNLAASGDYYQIPTLSLCGLSHGTYTVKIIVSKASASQTGAERLTYYLDGIRVYNPIQNLEGNSVVSNAYGESEINANFVEIRDKLLDAKSFNAGTTTSAGPVFIDRYTNSSGTHTNGTTTSTIATYEDFGPKNEVYLKKGQTIAFAVDYTADTHYYIGMKSPTGKTISTKVGSSTLSIKHTTDLYYKVTPTKTTANGKTIYIISVTNNGDYILSLTKLKVTGPSAQTFTFAMVRNATLLSYVDEVADSDTPDTDVPDAGVPDAGVPDAGVPDAGVPDAGVPDAGVPDAGVPDAGVPDADVPDSDAPGVEEPEETVPTEPDVDIDNPEPEQPEPEPEQPEMDPQDIAKKRMKAMLRKIFKYLGDWFNN